MGMSNYIPSSALTKAGVCTSITRPASPYVGQAIYETDTLRFRFWDGSSWSPIVDAPTGTVNSFAGSTAPTGWLLCAGQAVSRTTYADLFAVISTTYGAGDGSTTFNIPDLRGRTVAGLDNIGGTDAGRLDWANTLGTVGGAQTHTLTSAEMPSHTHTQNAHTHTQDAHSHVVTATNGWVPIIANITPTAGGNGYWTWTNVGSSQMTATGTTATNQNTTATNQNTGGGGSHNNMQPTILLNYIIRI